MHEPIDIYANPTYLPEPIRPQYDALWTPARMKRVIDAAIENDVAIEINARYKIPSPAFIKAAKAAGAKFSFGTNNAEAELGRLEYPIQMVKECGLSWQDIFVPKPDGQKPIQVKKWRIDRVLRSVREHPAVATPRNLRSHRCHLDCSCKIRLY